MKNEVINYKRITLKLSEESYRILLHESREKKRDTIVRDSLFLYSQIGSIHSSLLDALHIVKHVKIALEYMNFNFFVSEQVENAHYKTNYTKALDLLTELESYLENLRVSFFKK
jgi:hypothetical protein